MDNHEDMPVVCTQCGQVVKAYVPVKTIPTDNFMEMIHFLVKGNASLKTENASLKTEIASLKTENASLVSKVDALTKFIKEQYPDAPF